MHAEQVKDGSLIRDWSIKHIVEVEKEKDESEEEEEAGAEEE